MLADRLHRPVDEFLEMSPRRITQWLAFVVWRDREDKKKK
jgi:hypothetical protein